MGFFFSLRLLRGQTAAVEHPGIPAESAPLGVAPVQAGVSTVTARFFFFPRRCPLRCADT